MKCKACQGQDFTQEYNDLLICKKCGEKDNTEPLTNGILFDIDIKVSPITKIEKQHRVRTLIGSLEYGILKKAKIIPKTVMFTKVPKKGGDFPKLARKVSPSWLGLYIDYFLRFVLESGSFSPEYLSRAYHQLGQDQGGKVDEDDIFKEVSYFEDVAAFALSSLPEGKVQSEPEWSSGKVQGHPDIVIGDTVYDIKMSGRFGAMRIDTIFQLLSYYALAQANKLPITHIGLILPAQKMVLRVDLSNWDSTEFMKLLNKKAEKRDKNVSIDTPLLMEFMMMQKYIGSHVKRLKTLFKTVQQSPGQPIQIFLGSRLRAPHKFTDIDLAKTLQYITDKKMKVFIHSPYTLNLSRETTDDFIVATLEKHFQTAHAFGSSGIVIHLGNQAEMDYDEAYDNMCSNVIRSAVFASPGCPLLLETDSGGSILDNPTDLASFYLDLPDETKKNVAICLDTCHVFAANYDNYQTLIMFQSRGVPVKEIHYNDSKYAKGTKKDRHACIGKGLIGLKPLVAVAKYAIANNIPLVRE